MRIEIKLLSETATTPTQAHPGDAGWDLYSAEDARIDPGCTVKVHTGIAVALPKGTFGGIYARSGLATKQGLRPSNCVGVCDSQYRGEYTVALYNDSTETQMIRTGDRVAQLIVQPYCVCDCAVVDNLNATERGAGGFGSTGQ